MKQNKWLRTCLLLSIVLVISFTFLLLRTQQGAVGLRFLPHTYDRQSTDDNQNEHRYTLNTGSTTALNAASLVSNSKELSAWQNGIDTSELDTDNTKEQGTVVSSKEKQGPNISHTHIYDTNTKGGQEQPKPSTEKVVATDESDQTSTTETVSVENHTDRSHRTDDDDNALRQQKLEYLKFQDQTDIGGEASRESSNDAKLTENANGIGTGNRAQLPPTLDLEAQRGVIEALTKDFSSEYMIEVLIAGKKESRSLRKDVYQDELTGAEIDSTKAVTIFDSKLSTDALISQSFMSVMNSEVKIDTTRLTACHPVVWHIVAKDKNGDLVEDGGESFYAELRGPAIIMPTVRYAEKGIYTIEFTPFTPGKYSLQLRHDFSRHSGTTHGCSKSDSSGMFNQFDLDIEQIKVANGDAAVCAAALAKATSRGEWRKLTRKNNNTQSVDPDATSDWELGWPNFAAAALRTGWVEFADGEWDYYLLEKINVKKQARCAWHQEHPKKALWVYTPYDYSRYWFYPRPALMGKWLHVLGDSIDEGYLSDILTYSLSRRYKMNAVKSDITLPGWDWSEYHPLRVYYYRKLRFTLTFQKLTRPRLDGFHMYEDPPEYAGKEWPGSAGMHNIWQRALEVLPKKHQQQRPTMTMLHFGFHSLSRGLSPKLYELTLRKLVYWWKSDPIHGDIPLAWRGTTVTHFHERVDYVRQKHRCLTRYRLLERDRIAKTVMSETDTPVLDMWSVSDGRPSASWDRRHFSDRGDCYGTKVERSMLSVLLSHLSLISSRRIDS